MRRVIILLSALSLPLVLAGACSRADTLCDLVCECEHCNDFREDLQCAVMNNTQELSEIYGCDIQYEDYANCFESKGRCMEDEANFTTSAPGQCNSSSDTGFPCSTATDCAGFLEPSCEGGTCRQRACAGSMVGCSSDDDCSGEDECASEEDALQECIASASDDPTVAGIVDD